MALGRPCQEITNQVPVGATAGKKTKRKKQTTTVHAFFKNVNPSIKHLNFFVFHPLPLKFFEPTQGRERNKGVRAGVCVLFFFLFKGHESYKYAI